MLQEYNPEIKNGIIPPLENDEFYTLRLPGQHNYDSFDSLLAGKKIHKFKKEYYILDWNEKKAIFNIMETYN